MGSHFSRYNHREFILLSVLPVLASVLTRRPGAMAGWQQRLQDLDRALVDALPSVGRYCWETVIVLQR
jgi:hypothetical protein